MRTRTVGQARARLTSLIRRAMDGEEIAIRAGDNVIRLKPMEMVPWEDRCLYQEYGVTPAEWERFKKRMQKEPAKAVRKGTLTVFSGDIEKDLAD